jgi:hypothetical protein
MDEQKILKSINNYFLKIKGTILNLTIDYNEDNHNADEFINIMNNIGKNIVVTVILLDENNKEQIQYHVLFPLFFDISIKTSHVKIINKLTENPLIISEKKFLIIKDILQKNYKNNLHFKKNENSFNIFKNKIKILLTLFSKHNEVSILPFLELKKKEIMVEHPILQSINNEMNDFVVNAFTDEMALIENASNSQSSNKNHAIHAVHADYIGLEPLSLSSSPTHSHKKRKLGGKTRKTRK